ncbi:MAG TPA: hypothetical protein VFM58_20860 [Solirubrobacteraceae bacterium]|nr:hypothetical protein [Solirubrobacteraceae bacterium]
MRDVPVHLTQGRREACAGLAQERPRQLKTPAKQLTVLRSAGHRPRFEQLEHFHQFTPATVPAEAQGGRP